MKLGQSKHLSFAESLVNAMMGYGVAVTTQHMVFPLFGVHLPLSDNLKIGALFTVISILRSYWLRRVFNWWHMRKLQPLLRDKMVKDNVQKNEQYIELAKRIFSLRGVSVVENLDIFNRFVGDIAGKPETKIPPIARYYCELFTLPK